MTFAQASAFKMPLGKHRDRTLDAIAADDEGLKYLDWLRGSRDEDGLAVSNLDHALAAYLDDASIKKELEALR